jgi:hypothetical protein
MGKMEILGNAGWICVQKKGAIASLPKEQIVRALQREEA